jgi:hypothetical protein
MEANLVDIIVGPVVQVRVSAIEENAFDEDDE